MNISFDITGLTLVTVTDLRLLIDTNNDGLFSDEVNGTGVLSGATSLGSNMYQFSGVNIADGRRFTLGTIDSNATPLPLTLIDFSADVTHRNVNLKWETINERNMREFNMYRSADAQNWELISTVQGNGNGGSRSNYSLLDAQPGIGVNYYKLENVDNDATRSTLKTLAANVGEDGETAFQVYPNPCTDKLYIRASQRQSSVSQVCF